MKRIAPLLIAALLSTAVTGKSSADIIYTVSETIGVGSVTGTITTDGSLGVLTTSDIIGWNLTIFDGTSSFNLGIGNSQRVVIGESLSATLTDLLFDFTQVSGLLIFQNPVIGSGENWWCVENTGCGGFSDSLNIRVGSAFVLSQAMSGQVSIATTAPLVVAEPASLALLGAGLAGVGFMRRKRRSA